MKIALLGGTGFVGKNVGEVLRENNIPFDVASRSSSTDLRDKNACIDFFKKVKPDFIINCAAHVGSLNYVTKQAADVILDNSRMILSIYEAASLACPKVTFINPIANCAYPAKAETYIEDFWWDGHLHRSVLSYGSTRRLLWSVSECFAMQHGIRSLNLLVPNMYGPFDSTNPDKAHALNALISKFVKAQKSGENKVVIWGTGIAIREWLYAKDFGKIVLEILKNPNRLGLSEPLNIAQNFGLSVRELSVLIRETTNFSGIIEWETSMPDGTPKKVMDDNRFRKVFPGFQFTSFDVGIPATRKFYESIYPY